MKSNVCDVTAAPQNSLHGDFSARGDLRLGRPVQVLAGRVDKGSSGQASGTLDAFALVLAPGKYRIRAVLNRDFDPNLTQTAANITLTRQARQPGETSYTYVAENNSALIFIDRPKPEVDFASMPTSRTLIQGQPSQVRISSRFLRLNRPIQYV